MGKKETQLIVEDVFKSNNKKDRKEKLNRILMEIIKKATSDSLKGMKS